MVYGGYAVINNYEYNDEHGEGAVNPPHITDQPIIALMKRIGIEPGKSFDFDKLDPVVRNALATVPVEAQLV